MTDRPPPGLLRRRAALGGLAATPLLLGSGAGHAATPAAAGPTCRLTPQTTQGPFYVDPRLVRADLTEDRTGVPLELRLTVIAAGPCTPLPGARVDIWSADAQGLYSGYPRQGDDRAQDLSARHFLRGTQFADAAGGVVFRTLWPGWYRGRTTHVHVKVWTGERQVLTGQLYFPDAINAWIYGQVAAYERRGLHRDTFNTTDVIALGDAGHDGFCAVAEAADRYVATAVLAVDPALPTSTRPMPGMRPPGGMPQRGRPGPARLVPGVPPSGQRAP